MTYFMVNHTKTNASFVSTLTKSICDKLAAKKRRSLTKIVYFSRRNNLAQSQRSDYWQLIYCSEIRKKAKIAGISRINEIVVLL